LKRQATSTSHTRSLALIYGDAVDTRQPQAGEERTPRLDLSRPTPGDVSAVHTITSDPRVWEHFPSGRPTDPAQTAQLLHKWIAGWDSDGLAPWIARRRNDPTVIGWGGCTLLAGAVWNVSYRFAADEHGNGFATELASAARRAAERANPDLPVVAYLLEHNVASARVATKLGLQLVSRGPDAGNNDETAVRLVFASRPLSRSELAVLRR
jgi:RimJ/RimL family protein N-acetyltransferase